MVKPRRFLESEAALTDSLRRLAAVPRGSALVRPVLVTIAPSFARQTAGRPAVHHPTCWWKTRIFARATHRAADIGWKALARRFERHCRDGGDPCFCLVSLALAPWCDRSRLGEWLLSRPVAAARPRRHGPRRRRSFPRRNRGVRCVVVCGAVPRSVRYAGMARHAGDAIYVSGALGRIGLGAGDRPRQGMASSTCDPSSSGAGPIPARNRPRQLPPWI